MLKKHAVLLQILLAITLLLIATQRYPGGSYFDKNSVGFIWSQNFISNLFGAKAANGADNPAQYWAVAGMFFLSAGLALFFIGFSKRIPVKGAANIIRYVGAGGMFFTFLIATPLHDIMVTISSTLFLLGLFYITVFVFKTRLHVFKLLCVTCLLLFYTTLFIFGTAAYLKLLPIVQKVNFAFTLLVVLVMEYGTKKEDFQHIKVTGNKK